MRKIFFYFALFMGLFFTSCSETSTNGKPTSPIELDHDSYMALSICELDNSGIGNEITASGEIVFISEDDPDGIFAEMKEAGCEVGIFAPKEMYEQWEISQRNALRIGNEVSVWGKLVSFGGDLIIDLADIAEAQQDMQDSEVQENLTQAATIDLPEALPSVMLDVPLVYSGSNNLPGLCYLGAAGMLVRYMHPEIDFSDIIAYSGIGSSALHLDFPEMPSMLISPFMDQSIVFMAENLQMPFVLGLQSNGKGSDSFQPAGLPFEDNASSLLFYSDRIQAKKTLKQALSAGYPVMVYINMYMVHDDFSDDSIFWRDVLGKDQASHYMVVKGYDEQAVYLNDPTDPSDAAADLSANWDNFLDAWENTTGIENAPPLGPFWSFFLTEKGEIPSAVNVIALNLQQAAEAPSEIRLFAQTPSDDSFTLFLLLELANAREHFGEYLTRNEFSDAGAQYLQSGALLENMAIRESVNSEELLQVADVEEQALQLLLK